MSDAFLSCHHLVKRYGESTVVQDLSFEIRPGECLGVIGPNGAGKTTLVNVITGVYRGTGTIVFDGQRIEALKPYQISRLGVARTYQVVQPFPEMTALENVMAPATFAHAGVSLATARERPCCELPART